MTCLKNTIWCIRCLSIKTTLDDKNSCGKGNLGSKIEVCKQGAKKVIFTACHSGKLKLAFTSPNIISTSLKSVLMRRLISQFFCNFNSSKNFTCPSGKSRTAFTSPIAKSTSPGLSDTTFFACWQSELNSC